MGDTISFDTALGTPYTNPINSFLTGYKAAHDIQQQRLLDQTRAAAAADPTDQNAVNALAIYDPVGSQQLLAQQAAQRQIDANHLAATAYLSGPTNAFAAPVSAQPLNTAPPSPAQVVQPSGLPPVAPGASFDQAFAPLGAPGTPPQGAAPQAPGQGPPVPPAAQGYLAASGPAMQSVGAAAANGQIDPRAAWGKLIDVGGVDVANHLITMISNMDAVTKDRLATANEAIGKEAQKLLEVPQSQRAQILTQDAPMLAQYGITTQQVQQYIAQGLTDQQLHGAIGQAITVQGGIENARKQAELDLRTQELHTGLQDGYGNIVDRSTGKVIYSVNGTPGGSGDSLANRNNNPGNIRDGAYAKGLPGYVGSEGGFAKFDTPQSGQNAQLSLLNNYIERGFDTPAKIANRWAPAGDGNNNPAAYAKALADAAGIGVNDKVPPGKLTAIAAAQAKIEGYGSGGGIGSGGQGAGGWTHDAIHNAAWEAIIKNGGQIPRGITSGNKAVAAAINNEIASIAKSEGLSVEQMVQRGQDTNAAAKTLQDFTSGPEANQVRVLNNASAHLATLGNLADALNNGNIPMFNKIAQSWAEATGNPAPTNLKAASQLVGGELVKIIAGAKGGSEGERLGQQASAALATYSAPGQAKGAVATIKELLGSQLQGLARQYKAGTNRDDFAQRFLSPLVRASWPMEASPHPTDITSIMQKYGVH